MTDTLTKFGVPLGGGAGRGGIMQPKFKYRFRVRFINFGPLSTGLDLSLNTIKIDRPKLSYEEVEVQAYNSRAYFAGKHQWGEIGYEVRDDINNAVSSLVGQQIQKQMNNFEQTAFLAAVNYKFTTIIETLDGGNEGVLETWTLEGCWLKEVTYEPLEYEQATGLLSIQMTIRYDNATLGDGLFPLGTGSGGTVSGGLGYLPGTTIGS